MNDFTFQNTTKVYFGKNQLQNLSKEVLKYGTKVLFATGGSSVKNMGLYDKVMNELKIHEIEVFELEGIEPNPRHTTVNKGVKMCKDNHIPVILAVGGGSTIDCCKAIAATARSEADDCWDLISGVVKWTEALPVIAMPTIASTGSEMDKSCVISNVELNTKRGINGEQLRPVVSFLNPEYTISVPAFQTACGGFDIMMHLIDMNYFVNDDKNPLQFNVVESLLRTVREQLPICLKEPESYEARGTLLWAASWALNSFCTSGFKTLPSNHALEQFSAFYDKTHGLGLSIVVTRWMTYLLNKDETVASDFARFGTNVMGTVATGDVMIDAKAAIDALDAYITNELKLPRTLTEIGITEKTHWDEMAMKATYNMGTLYSYRNLKPEDIKEIYDMCM